MLAAAAAAVHGWARPCPLLSAVGLAVKAATAADGTRGHTVVWWRVGTALFILVLSTIGGLVWYHLKSKALWELAFEIICEA